MMTSHKLAKILLNNQDLPVATHANNHTATNTDGIGVMKGCGGVDYMVIGNFWRADLNYPNEYIKKVISGPVKDMIRFREHRGSFEDSMDTMMFLPGIVNLGCHVRRVLGEAILDHHFDLNKISIKAHGGIDIRNGWDTHILDYKTYGVVGYVDSDLKGYK